MRTASVIARYLAGVIFLVFGPERLPELHSPSPAGGHCWTVYGCPLCLALPVGDLRVSGHRSVYFCWSTVTYRWRWPCWRR